MTSQQSISTKPTIKQYETDRRTVNNTLRNSRLNLTPNVRNQIDPADNDYCIQGTAINKSIEYQRIRQFLNHPRTTTYSSQALSLADQISQTLNNYTPNSIPECTKLVFELDILQDFSVDLFNKFVHFPSHLIALMDKACNEQLKEVKPDFANLTFIKTFPTNMPVQNHYKIRNLSVEQISNLISIRGLVLRCSEIIPLMLQGKFVCSYCEDILHSDLTDGIITEPKQCNQCKSADTQRIKHNGSSQEDSQYIKIQEDPSDLPHGETAQNVLVQVSRENVDVVKPGDRIELIGIQCVDSKRVNSHDRRTNTTMKTFINVISFTKVDSTKSSSLSHGEEGVGQFANEQIQQFIAFSQREDVLNILTKSFAPSIQESDTIKFGLLTQLFGGVEKKLNDTRADVLSKRGEINVLLLGDPSTGKSQLLKQVNKLAPRGVQTSGKGSSAVGLTAHVAKDPETGELVLESGALVLSDRGVCCIDEFDKMSMSGRSVLHEVMEQQTISIAKAGIICNLNARTAVLAAANPIESKQNKFLSVVKNINLPPSLISRFDLIYIILDEIDEEKDSKMADHILDMFSELDLNREVPETESSRVSTEFLRNYIMQARLTCRPKLMSESQELLVRKQVEMRRQGNTTRTISATPRQLESMVRISESIAKMRLSTVVTAADVELAYKLFQEATKQSMTDPKTGIIDIGQFSGGLTFEDNQLTTEVAASVQRQFVTFKQALREGLEVRKLTEDLNKEFRDTKGVTLATRVVIAVLENLQEDGKILLSGNHTNRLIKIIE